MRKMLRNLSIACLAGSLIAAPAFADRDHDHDKDRDDHHSEHHDRDHDRDRDHHRDWDRDHDRDPEHHREHHYRRTNGDPPGWEHGKKKGWGDCDVPPGQAKKHGCNDHDRDDHRREHPTSAPVVKPRPEVHRSSAPMVPVLKPRPEVHRTSTTTVPVLKPHVKAGAKPEVQ